MPEQPGPDHASTARQRLARVLAPAGSPPLPELPEHPGGPAGTVRREPVPGDGGPAGPGRLRPAVIGADGGHVWGVLPPDGRPHRGSGLAGRLGAAAAFDPGRPGLRVLAVIAVVVVLGAGVLAWWSRPRPDPVEPRVTVATVAEATPTGTAELVVAVSGEVREPGLVRLPPGARVADAIEAAGGLRPDADVDQLNLARKVADGELIAVGVPGVPVDQAGGGAAPGPGGKVNLNTATLTELDTLPGIGPTLAQRILDYRTEHGQFGSVEELRQVSGIGDIRFAELRDLVTV